MGIGDLKGPLLIDSLDHPNPSNQNTQPQVIKKTNKDYVTLIIILISLVPLAFSSFLILYFFQDVNPLIEFVRWVFLLAFPLATTSLLVGLCVYSVSWLQGWSSKNKLVSLHDGPWHNADIKLTPEAYDMMFSQMMSRYFDAMNERAAKSIYSGVSTLTIDQSTSTSSTTNQKDQAATQSAEPTKNDGNGVVFDLSALQFLDFVNGGKK